MPTIPYRCEKSQDDDEDYEIVSFEDFCDRSSTTKSDLLTLNDNINYRLCYANDNVSKLTDSNEQGASIFPEHSETSLDEPKNNSSIRKGFPIKPFGRHDVKNGREPLFRGIVPKAKNDGDSGQHRYQRFSEQHNVIQRIWDHIPSMGSGVLLVAIVCALCVGVWWAVCGAMGGTWGEEHYKKLWERTHPEIVKEPLMPTSFEKIPSEHHYHDHNNLSTKNKINITEVTKKDFNKKSTFTERPPEVMQNMCAQTSENMRFDCFPQSTSNEEDCIKRGCCWKPTTTKGVPYCFYPPQYDTFRFLNMTENKHGISVYYEKNRPSGYPGDFNVTRLDFKYMSNDALEIKIYDGENRRFESPYPEFPLIPGFVSQMKYRVVVESASIGFKVVRNVDNVTIFNTQDIGGLILSNQMLQISAILPTDHLYGLGEKRSKFMIDMNWQTLTMFNRDTVPVENMNLYGTHPFYLAMENDGNSHGVLLLNSNAIDAVLQPTPAITYRAIGGIFNFLILMGPTPKEVISQYTEMIGKPFMPPYWSLGFHLCRFNYGSLNATREVWHNNRAAGIPFDTQWNDLDYMNNSNDFTYDMIRFQGLPEFVQNLHKEGMHYIVLIDPGVSASEKPGDYPPYDRGLQLDVFIKNSTDQPFVGKVWNKQSTVFPDFTHPSASAYWIEMLTSLHEKVPFDGLWIDMNEPSNFISGTMYGECEAENLPYTPHMIGPDGLKTKTLCMDAKHFAGRHYDWHNLHTLTEAINTHFALLEILGRRPFIISRATFPGSGHFTGHWSGDNLSDWHDMKMSIPELLSFSLFGIPMMGADICGFRGDTTPELCKRWMQLGAFYPFSRNHNSDSSAPQDPVSLGEEVVEASKRALRLRYRLLPYYYTLFWKAHVDGETVARPLFFEWPENTITHDIDAQFLLGSYVMITPILEKGATYTHAYFPGPERWYNILDGTFLSQDKWHDVNENQTISVKGGAIIPMQEPPTHGPVTTTNSRSCPMQLLVVPDNNNYARGDLYWDDGDRLNSYEEKKYSQIKFSQKNNEVRSMVPWWGYGVPPVNNITILNQHYAVKSVTINDVPCKRPQCEFAYIASAQVLQIYNINLSLDKPFSIKWMFKQGGRLNYGINFNNTKVICKDNRCD